MLCIAGCLAALPSGDAAIYVYTYACVHDVCVCVRERGLPALPSGDAAIYVHTHMRAYMMCVSVCVRERPACSSLW